jgi:hypothetical protein
VQLFQIFEMRASGDTSALSFGALSYPETLGLNPSLRSSPSILDLEAQGVYLKKLNTQPSYAIRQPLGLKGYKYTGERH